MHAAAPKTPLGSQAGAGMMPYRTLRLPGGKLGAATYKRACLCARTSKVAGSIVWLHCRASRKTSRRHRVNPQQMVDALHCGA